MALVKIPRTDQFGVCPVRYISLVEYFFPYCQEISTVEDEYFIFRVGNNDMGISALSDEELNLTFRIKKTTIIPMGRNVCELYLVGINDQHIGSQFGMDEHDYYFHTKNKG